MLHLYVLRHGEAEPRAPRDELRRLTERGIGEVTSTCEQLPDIESLDYVYASPYVRAQQTAEIVCRHIGGGKIHQRCDHITPSSSVSSAVEFLHQRHQHETETRILLASHMPFVAELVNVLSNSDDGPLSMPTASLAYLSCEVLAKDCCELNWIKRP